MATLIGRSDLTDPASAALLNGMSSAVYSFDDTHAAAIVHPGGPVASALLALCEQNPTSGADFLLAFIIGAELVCRLSKAISVAPAKARSEWLQTSVCGGIGAALACGRRLGLNETQMISSIGIAASRASGFRGLSRSMCFSYMAGSAALAGLEAALLAQCGVVGPEEPLRGDHRFCAVFSAAADPDALTSDLGSVFELAVNTFKPYPCGIVIHSIIDACLKVSLPEKSEIQRVTIEVNSMVQRLADVPDPKDQFEAQMSMQHWAACALLNRSAGIEETKPAALDDERIRSLRKRVEIRSDDKIPRSTARVTVNLVGGGEFLASVDEGRGSVANPLRDEDLQTKFLNQAVAKLGEAKANRLAEACWQIEEISNIGQLMALSRKGSGCLSI
jgi:2-methylcitrate dehydratase PrpD